MHRPDNDVRVHVDDDGNIVVDDVVAMKALDMQFGGGGGVGETWVISAQISV